MTTSFRNKVAFGKRIEFYIVGLMLKEGLDVYLPMVDDDAVDAVVKRPDGQFVEVQIKARSRDVVFGDAALFAGIRHEQRPNYWFVFYSERMNLIWILASKEFIEHSSQNRKGKHEGLRSIWFNGKSESNGTEHTKPKFERFIASDFSRIMNCCPND